MPSHDSVAQICFRHEFADDDEMFGTQDDAAYIVAACNAVPALLDTIDEQKREIVDRYTQLRWAQQEIDELRARMEELEDELTAAYNVIAARDRHIDALEAELLALKTQEPDALPDEWPKEFQEWYQNLPDESANNLWPVWAKFHLPSVAQENK